LGILGFSRRRRAALASPAPASIDGTVIFPRAVPPFPVQAERTPRAAGRPSRPHMFISSTQGNEVKCLAKTIGVKSMMYLNSYLY
jgi:hypothetical protein